MVLIDLDIAVDVSYKVDTNPPEEKHVPITITAVTFRGADIYHLLHIGHIMAIQRRIYNRLLDSGVVVNGVYAVEPPL